MIYAFLAGLFLLLLFIGIGNIYDSSKLPFFKKLLKIALIAAVIIALAFLVASGRISAVAAVLGGLFIWLARLLQLGILYNSFKRSKGAGYGANPSSSGDKMTEKEAWEILGLKSGASKEEIIKAYRDLMAKLHPDHGGNDYLASRLNQAKEILLKKK